MRSPRPGFSNFTTSAPIPDSSMAAHVFHQLPQYNDAMPDSTESNAAVWKSDASVAQWVATAEDREHGRAWARHLLAELLPFTEADQFTFVDLGAGTGAAARAVLDRYPASSAVAR